MQVSSERKKLLEIVWVGFHTSPEMGLKNVKGLEDMLESLASLPWRPKMNTAWRDVLCMELNDLYGARQSMPISICDCFKRSSGQHNVLPVT